MAHEIESVILVGKPAWHRLGTVFDTPPSLDDAIVASGLSWSVGLEPLFTSSGVEVPARAVVRDRDGQVLGVVGPDYAPVQNANAFAWFRPWVESGEVAVESAGSLRGGRRIWVLCRITRDSTVDVVPGDSIQRYILLSNSHDGTLTVRAGFTNVRVVCANTLAESHDSHNSRLLRVRHTSGAQLALDNIREIIDVANQQFRDTTLTQYQQLARHGVSVQDLRRFITVTFDLQDQQFESSRVATKVIDLFESSPDLQTANVRGTAWALYNAATALLSHRRGRSADTRQDSLWFGDSARLNRRALATALQLAA